MNFVRFFYSNCSKISNVVPRLLSDKTQLLARLSNVPNFSTLTSREPGNAFLVPTAVSIMPSCGLKIKGKYLPRYK